MVLRYIVCHRLQIEGPAGCFDLYSQNVLYNLLSLLLCMTSASLCCWLWFCCDVDWKPFNCIWADEFKNFLERLKVTEKEFERQVWNPTYMKEETKLELRLWASYRGQTLARTGIEHLQCEISCYCQVFTACKEM